MLGLRKSGDVMLRAAQRLGKHHGLGKKTISHHFTQI